MIEAVTWAATTLCRGDGLPHATRLLAQAIRPPHAAAYAGRLTQTDCLRKQSVARWPPCTRCLTATQVGEDEGAHVLLYSSNRHGTRSNSSSATGSHSQPRRRRRTLRSNRRLFWLSLVLVYEQ
ncbi:hypothetical protein B296_00039404 [Ensete ventricosum]|uniref:Uncharacterized protein n=1 Tax=Ensete ventricosum TaxID=4639 RepID=A0A426XMH5_ENSVE|nr:hypothetical protein B296_00039404 [Ensete ventricosum]